MQFEVYLHTSSSGKAYVGWTSRGWRKRWQNHLADAKRGRGGPFYNALRRYGAAAFTHEILAVARSESQAKLLERECILSIGTLEPAGYNATSGGDGAVYGKGVRCRLSAALVGNKRGCANKGKRRSAEERARMSVMRTGRKVGEDTRTKMRASWTPERKAKRAAQAAAYWTPEKRSEQAERTRARYARG